MAKRGLSSSNHHGRQRSRRLSNNKAAKEEELDRLSSLPDEILTNILSRLSIHSAASTSVLSHRWHHLWTAVTRFVFPCDPFQEKDNSTMVVHHILRQLTSPILYDFGIAFSELSEFPEPDEIQLWVYEICRRNVENLCLDALTEQDEDFVVPSLFTCQSLVSLTLCGRLFFELDGNFHFHFPHLNSLILEHIEDEYFTGWLGNLIRSCPLLESLELNIGLHLPDQPEVDDSVEIFAPNLRSLLITFWAPVGRQRTKFYVNALKLINLEISDCYSLYDLVQPPTLLV